jgi:hypothetical protein
MKQFVDRPRRISQGQRIDRKSPYLGVYWDRFFGTWTAKVYDTRSDECHDLGHFESEIAAAQAYDKTARMLFGSKARLNNVYHPSHGVRKADVIRMEAKVTEEESETLTELEP